MSKVKKLIALFLTFFFCATSNCYAFSALYYIKGIKTTEFQPIVESGFYNQKFSLVKTNPYYGISQNGDESAVVIIQQSGDNMFYYYQSEDNNLKVNKYVIKELTKKITELKKMDITDYLRHTKIEYNRRKKRKDEIDEESTIDDSINKVCIFEFLV